METQDIATAIIYYSLNGCNPSVLRKLDYTARRKGMVAYYNHAHKTQYELTEELDKELVTVLQKLRDYYY